MKSTFKFGAFIGAMALSAGMAQADTIIFDPFDAGEDTISQQGSDNNLSIDFNGDDNIDLTLGIRDFGLRGAFMRGVNLPQPPAPVFDGGGGPNGDPVVVPVGDPFDDRPLDPNGPVITGDQDDFYNPFQGYLGDYQEVRISNTLFDAGDEINDSTFGSATSQMWLYGRSSSFAQNILPTVGDSGIFGIRIQSGIGRYYENNDIGQNGFEAGEPIETFYGFIEIRHGSIVIGQAGFNTTAGASIIAGGGDPMTPVPLPAGGALLVTGMLGLAALRRRQKTTV